MSASSPTGAGGNITISSTVYAVDQWALNLTNELQDVTTTSSAGWVERMAGYGSASASFGIFLGTKDAAGVLSTVNQFAPGASFTADFTVGGSTHKYSGTFLVSTANITNAAKPTPKLDITAESRGPVTFA